MKLIRKVIHYSCAALCLLIISCDSIQEKTDLSNQPEAELNPEAPVETKILGQLAGEWAAEQSFLDSDGTWKEEKKHSIWKWYYILDGHAIQDDWITVDSLNNRNMFGTNIRIYNTEEKKWYMAWIDKTNRKLATFTAENDKGNVIMDGTNAKGRHIRNTFFNITKKEFDWKQEWTFDEGNTWVVVTKIHCKRKS